MDYWQYEFDILMYDKTLLVFSKSHHFLYVILGHYLCCKCSTTGSIQEACNSVKKQQPEEDEARKEETDEVSQEPGYGTLVIVLLGTSVI